MLCVAPLNYRGGFLHAHTLSSDVFDQLRSCDRFVGPVAQSKEIETGKPPYRSTVASFNETANMERRHLHLGREAEPLSHEYLISRTKGNLGKSIFADPSKVKS
jgi:hypothetical protein